MFIVNIFLVIYKSSFSIFKYLDAILDNGNIWNCASTFKSFTPVVGINKFNIVLAIESTTLKSVFLYCSTKISISISASVTKTWLLLSADSFIEPIIIYLSGVVIDGTC